MILLLKLFRTPTDYRRTWPAALCWHGVDVETESVARRPVWKTANVTIIDCALSAIFFSTRFPISSVPPGRTGYQARTRRRDP